MLGRERKWCAIGTAAACALLACGQEGPRAIDEPPINPELMPNQPTAGNGAPPASTPSSFDPPASTAVGSTSTPVDPGASATPTLPCDVASIVGSRCLQCHGENLLGGAPMHLLTHADFQQDLVVKTTEGLIGQTMQAHALIRHRVNSETAPMPPGSRLPDADLATLDAWLAAGAPAASVQDASCPNTAAPPPEPVEPEVSADPNETCFELRMHGGQTPGDTSPYTIKAREYYQCFYYDVPWTLDAEGTRFGNLFENEAVLHHWLLYTTNTSAPGTSVDCVGSHVGDDAQLLAGWAVGGRDVVMPKDTGLDLPAPGTHLLVEWHLYNTTGRDIVDSSGVQVCTVPRGSRARTAGMTWLGTENFNGLFGMPPGVESRFSGTCVPSRAGMNGSDPIRIFAFLPHMHKLGRGMVSVVNRADGTQEEVFNRPFDFNQQIHYDVDVELYPGDTITSTCVFFNDTSAAVAYGNSSDTEMCYQFAFSSPAGALANGAFGLNGASNNCW